jgi:hypothetical protein
VCGIEGRLGLSGTVEYSYKVRLPCRINWGILAAFASRPKQRLGLHRRFRFAIGQANVQGTNLPIPSEATEVLQDFAAAMSNLSGSLNSLSSSTVKSATARFVSHPSRAASV